MFTQNPKINTCHIFVLLHKSIFLTFVCKTDVQIKTFATTDRRSFGRDARCSQWLPGGVSPAATTSALVEGKKISWWEGTRPPGDPLPRSWCSVPKGFQGKCGSQDTRPCFSPAKDCKTLGHWTISSPSVLLVTVSVGALLVSEQRRRSSSWCCNWMKCSCGWSLLNSASQLLEELESWTMRLADFV